MRKLVDRIVAACGLLATTPISLAILIVVFAADRRNPIFAQSRLGQSETPFTLYKFRTMRPETPSVTTHNLSQSALTPVGAILRQTKLDELPQLVNVLKGEMALVGPRPGLPDDTALTTARRAAGVFDVLPGITGLAQLSGIDMSDPDRLAGVDAEYVAMQSARVDLRLVAQTICGGGSGDALGAS